MIVVNGCPKSGTHSVMAWLDRMGLKRAPGTLLACSAEQELHVAGADAVPLEAAAAMPDNVYILAHVHAGYDLGGFRVVTVFRDPRNVLVSYCRHRKRVDGVDVTIEEAIADFWGAPFVETYCGFLGWRGKSIVLRYEDLPSEAVGDGSGIYEGSERDWNTRTGAPSRWQDHWTLGAELAWDSAGGAKLLERAGYS